MFTRSKETGVGEVHLQKVCSEPRMATRVMGPRSNDLFGLYKLVLVKPSSGPLVITY